MEEDKKIDTLEQTVEYAITKRKHFGSKGEDKEGLRMFRSALRNMLGLEPLHGDE